MKLLLVVVSLMAVASGRWHDYECHCGLFIRVHEAMIEVHRLRPYDLESCDDEPSCKIRCEMEWEYIVNHGGLHYQSPNDTMNIGDDSCLTVSTVHDMEDLDAHEVYGYYKVCEGPWQSDGQSSKDHLCCSHGYYPGSCDQ